MAMAARLERMNPKLTHYQGLTKIVNGNAVWTGQMALAPEHILTEPLRRKKPTMYFVNSMSDLFHKDVPDEFIAQVFAVMAATPQHTYQILTKRPQRMAELIGARSSLLSLRGDGPTHFLPLVVRHMANRGVEAGEWPLQNVWLGTSIESDRYSWRADHLRRTPAAVRFISAEPLLGPLTSLDLTGIDWLIVGGESGPGARPMHPAWVRDLRDRCTGPERPLHRDGTMDARRAPAFFFKQWGEWAPGRGDRRRLFLRPDGGQSAVDSGATVEVVRAGRRAAGDELDGRRWQEFPAGVVR